MYRCRGSLASDYGWRCVQAAAALRAGASVARTLCSLALAGLGFGLFGFLLWYGSSYQAPPWMVWLLPVMAILLLAAFLAKDSEIGLGPESVQTETLSRGLCPCCWELIAGIPPDADGFTMCPECGSAWRLPEPAPDRAPPMTCRACGYDLHGLDPDDRGVVTCPECGDVWIR